MFRNCCELGTLLWELAFDREKLDFLSIFIWVFECWDVGGREFRDLRVGLGGLKGGIVGCCIGGQTPRRSC